MDYSKKTPEQLIIIIGERDTKIEGLLAQLKDKDAVVVQLKNAGTNLEKSLDAISKERLADANTLKDLGEVVAKNNEIIVGLQGQLADASTLIVDLKGKLNEATETLESVTDEVIIKYGQDVYKPALKNFTHNRMQYKDTDLKSNPALVKELIEENLGVLIKQPKAGK